MVSLSMVVTEADGKYLEKSLSSVKDVCTEAIIVNQGNSPKIEKIVKKVFPHALILPSALKGFCEPDREYSVLPTPTEFVLIMDADETMSPELAKLIKTSLHELKKEIDVFFIPFKNTVDGIDISDILGNDYHPRLYKKGAVTWESAMHAQPNIKSPNGYFLNNEFCMLHERTSDQIIESHKRRVKIKDPNAMQMEMGFLQRLSQKLNKDLVKPVFGEQKRFSSI